MTSRQIKNLAKGIGLVVLLSLPLLSLAWSQQGSGTVNVVSQFSDLTGSISPHIVAPGNTWDTAPEIIYTVRNKGEARTVYLKFRIREAGMSGSGLGLLIYGVSWDIPGYGEYSTKAKALITSAQTDGKYDIQFLLSKSSDLTASDYIASTDWISNQLEIKAPAVKVSTPSVSIGTFDVKVFQGGTQSTIFTVRNTGEVQIKVTNFTPNYGEFKGEITANNLPTTLDPGETRNVNLSVTVYKECKTGKYTIPFTLSGTP